MKNTEIFAAVLIFCLLLLRPACAQKPIEEADMQAGPFRIGGCYDENSAAEHFGKPLKNDTMIKRFDGFDLFISSDGIIMSLQIHKPLTKLKTARGLAVGDPASKAPELYGKPGEELKANQKFCRTDDPEIRIFRYGKPLNDFSDFKCIRIVVAKGKVTHILIDKMQGRIGLSPE